MKKKWLRILLILALFLVSITEASAEGTAEPKFKLPDYVFQIPIGTLTKLNMVDCSSGTCQIPFVAQYVSAIYKYGLSIAGVLSVFMLMAAGLLWIVSGGDSNKITTAKKMIGGSIFGLTILTGLVLFLSFINPDLAVTKIISLESINDLEPDTDIGNDENIYAEGCKASKNNKDFSVCKNYGSKKPTGMTTVQGIRGSVQINTSVYQKYLAAMECVKEKNGNKELFGINEGFRDPATQIKYWETKPEGQAAYPCCSNHGNGIAMDINRLDGNKMSWDYNRSSGLESCMNSQSLFAKIKKEPWHWSPTGR